MPLIAVPNAPAPVFTPAVPAAGRLILNASVAASLRFGGGAAADGGLVDTWQDQSGHGFNAVQAVGGSQPFYDAIAFRGGPCVMWGGRGLPLFNEPKSMTIAGLTFAIPYVLVILARGNSFGDANYASALMTFAELSTGIGGNDGVLLRANNNFAAQTRKSANTQSINAASPFWAGQNYLAYYTLENDGTNTKLSVNGVLQAVSQAGTAPGVGAIVANAILGNNHAGTEPLTGALAFLGIWDALSPAERGGLDAYFRSIWGGYSNPYQQSAYNMFQIGDSIAGGANLAGPSFPNAWSFCERASRQLGGRFRPFNRAQSGAALVGAVFPDITTQWVTFCRPHLVSGVKTVVGLEGGINDIGAGADAPTTFGRYDSLVNTIVGDLGPLTGGPHHLFCFTIEYDAGNVVTAQAVNTSIRAAIAGWNALSPNVHVHLVDIGADAMLGTVNGQVSSGNLNYFQNDDLHPASSGQERWGALYAQQLLAAGL